MINTYMTDYYDYVGTIGYNKKEYKGRDYDFISFNCNDVVLNDPAVRRAIALGIDRNSIVSATLENRKIASTSPLDYGSYLHTEEELLKYNQDDAKKILEEAGWTYSKNAWLKKVEGVTKKLAFNLTVYEDNTDRANVAEAIKSQLAEIGIIINVQYVNYDKYAEILNNKNYQMMITGIENSINPNLTYFFGENNLANYSNEEIQNNLGDIEKISEILKKANEEVPYIGLYRNKGITILNANMGGDFAINSYNIYYNFNTWYRQQ